VDLLQSYAVIKLYVGDARDPSSDTLVATGAWPISLAAMQASAGSLQSVTLDWVMERDEEAENLPPKPAAAVVNIFVTPDVGMEERCRGGRLMTVRMAGVEATSVPEAWGHPFTWDQLQDAERGEAWKETTFELTLGHPLGLPPPPPPPPPAVVAATEGDGDGKEGGEDGKAGDEGKDAEALPPVVVVVDTEPAGVAFDGGRVAPPSEPPAAEDGDENKDDGKAADEGKTSDDGKAGEGDEDGDATPPPPLSAQPIVAWEGTTGTATLFLDREATRGLKARLASGAGDACMVSLARYPTGKQTEGDAAAAGEAVEGEEGAPPSAPVDTFSGSVDLASLLQPESTELACDSCVLSLGGVGGGKGVQFEGKYDGQDEDYGDDTGGDEGKTGVADGPEGLAVRSIVISFDQCLVRMPPPPPPLTLTTGDLIAPRAPVELAPFGKDAAEMLRDDVAAITAAVAGECAQLFYEGEDGGVTEGKGGGGGELMDTAAGGKEDRRRALL
jgi:hypothetical protein